MASVSCGVSMTSRPARSATVRATLRMRCPARGDKAQALNGAAEESPIARPQAAIALDLGQAQAAAGLARATAQTFKADAPFRS
jgi:hypothetical protein